MFLRVQFGDNDFDKFVKRACDSVLLELLAGYKGEEAIKRYKEEKEKYGLEAIRKSIVLASYGYYIANQGIQSYCEEQKSIYDMSQHEDILPYLDKRISIEEVEQFSQEWENYETCYIDFHRRQVYLQ